MNARNLNNTAMSITDRRAPGVSAALRSRIGTLLGSGATVSLRRDNLVLRDIVLTRQNGTETPAAEEMRLQVARRGLDPAPFTLERFDRDQEVEQAGTQAFAFDKAGKRHMITRQRLGQRVATAAGVRFYREAPLTQWIVNVPVATMRLSSGRIFNLRYMPITDAFPLLPSLLSSPPSLRWTRDGGDTQGRIEQMLQLW